MKNIGRLMGKISFRIFLLPIMVVCSLVTGLFAEDYLCNNIIGLRLFNIIIFGILFVLLSKRFIRKDGFSKILVIWQILIMLSNIIVFFEIYVMIAFPILILGLPNAPLFFVLQTLFNSSKYETNIIMFVFIILYNILLTFIITQVKFKNIFIRDSALLLLYLQCGNYSVLCFLAGAVFS